MASASRMLSALLGEACASDPEIKGLAADSRDVREGFLFAALAGVNADGAAYADEAVKKGAVAVLAAPGAFDGGAPPDGAVMIEDANPRRRLAQIAARFHPRQPETLVGVTGTNGKTSTVWFAAQIWAALGEKAASLGTLGARIAGESRVFRELHHTTPDPIVLHETLDALAGAGARRLAMEVSSHALAQHRADGVVFAGAGFTNITRDHLDYHADFNAYLAAKLRLFEDLVADGGYVVANAPRNGAEDRAENRAGLDAVKAAAEARGLRFLTTGAGGTYLRLLSARPRPTGLSVEIGVDGEKRSLNIPLIGEFQAENALLAAGLVLSAAGTEGGGTVDDILAALETLEGPPGRMQFVADANGGAIYVDYAHTPDAVATALAAIRPHAEGRVIVVLGAGGDRDRAKRPLMGAAAARGADHVIVTDDNPRTEDPARIRKAVLTGAVDVKPGATEEIGDRVDAIERGVSMLGKGDILLIAGKGHETGQTIGRETYPFDDAEMARAAAARASKESAGTAEAS